MLEFLVTIWFAIKVLGQLIGLLVSIGFIILLVIAWSSE